MRLVCRQEVQGFQNSQSTVCSHQGHSTSMSVRLDCSHRLQGSAQHAQSMVLRVSTTPAVWRHVHLHTDEDLAGAAGMSKVKVKQMQPLAIAPGAQTAHLHAAGLQAKWSEPSMCRPEMELTEANWAQHGQSILAAQPSPHGRPAGKTGGKRSSTVRTAATMQPGGAGEDGLPGPQLPVPPPHLSAWDRVTEGAVCC